MKKIPTAEAFLIDNANVVSFDEGQLFNAVVTPKMLIAFAKLHVEAALTEVGCKVIGTAAGSVMDIYPLENIK